MSQKNFAAITTMLAELGFPNVSMDDKFSMHYYTVGLLNIDVRYHDGENRNATFSTLGDGPDFTTVERFNPATLDAALRLDYVQRLADSGVAYGTVARIFDTTVMRIRSMIESVPAAKDSES